MIIRVMDRWASCEAQNFVDAARASGLRLFWSPPEGFPIQDVDEIYKVPSVSEGDAPILWVNLDHATDILALADHFDLMFADNVIGDKVLWIDNKGQRFRQR